MASSPAHRFGQIIGDLVESTMINYLNDVAQDYSLYLDYRHPRKARNSQNEVIWVDINKNKHKLDIVMEDGGTEESFGIPRVFIEVAWRKYTKHSKNKVQEISGAIVPLIEKYGRYSPFYLSLIHILRKQM